MTKLDIQKQDNTNSGRYYSTLSDGTEAEVTYVKKENGTLIINHAGVPKPYEGQGIALALVTHMVEDVRKMGIKVIPTCPYVVVQFKRHKDWADVLA